MYEAGPALRAPRAAREDVLEGGVDRRLDVAKALHVRDAVDLSDALRALIDAEEAKARKDADLETCSLRSDESTFFPNRWVSVEGLALLALAERQGVDVPDLLPACPPLARAGVFGPFRSRGYPHVNYVKE